MKTIKRLLFVSFLLFGYLISNAQTESTTVYPDMKIDIGFERFNVSSIRNRYKGSILDYTYMQSNGAEVRITSYRRGSEIEVFEKFPAPYIHTLYKEFYPDGRLKQKGVLLPRQVKIGKWIECDRNGNHKIIDHEVGREGFGYNDVLLYLEHEDYYNSTDNTWSYLFSHSSGKWTVRLSKGTVQYKRYIFDDKTGDVIEEELYKASAPPATYDYEPEKE